MGNNQVEIAQETFPLLCFALHVTTLEVYKECFLKTHLREKIVEGAKYAFDFPIDASLIQDRVDQCQLYLRKHPEAEIIRWLHQIQQAELSILLHTPITWIGYTKLDRKDKVCTIKEKHTGGMYHGKTNKANIYTRIQKTNGSLI
ncbi:hypothetical protein CCE97_14840 [Listeria monocytogenes]|nr:hypothetical protein [Listeria monocytogenes]